MALECEACDAFIDQRVGELFAARHEAYQQKSLAPGFVRPGEKQARIPQRIERDK